MAMMNLRFCYLEYSTMGDEKFEVVGFRTTQIDQIFRDSQHLMLDLKSVRGTGILYD